MASGTDAQSRPSWMPADWPSDEFGHPKRIWDMTPSEMDRAAASLKAMQR